MRHDPLAAAGPRPDLARRARILGHLEYIGPGPKATYATLCGLLDDPDPLPAVSMLLHHMLRELESALREVMREPQSGSSGELAAGGVEQRRGEIMAMVAALELAPGAGGEQHRQAILSLIGELELAAGKERHRAEIEAITAALGVEQAVVTAWTGIVGKSHAWAHRRALSAPEALDLEVRARIDRLEGVFDVVLDAHAVRYKELVHERLEALLAIEAPTSKDAARLRTEFPQDTLTQEAFFGRAGRAWLPALRGARMFKSPPGLADAGEGYVSFPWWPASAYLIRMAEQARIEPGLDAGQVKVRTADQVTITEIAVGIAASDNPRIGMDLARTALLLAPPRAARLAEKLAEALGNRHVIGAESYGAVAVALAEGGQRAAAAIVLRALLTLDGEDEQGTRIGDWEYGELLRCHTDALTDAMGLEALDLFVSLMTLAAGEDGAEPRLRTVAGADTGENMFEPWSGLVASVREIAVRLVRAGVPAEQILTRTPLDQGRVLIRIRLHLLGLEEFAAAVPDQVRALMSDPVLLHAPATEPEFLRLLEARAELLAVSERTRLQAAIEAGPDTAQWLALRAARSPDDLARLAVRWRLERYAAAAAILDEAGRKTLDEMVTTYGVAPFQRPRADVMVADPSAVAGLPDTAVAEAATTAELAAAAAAAREAATADPRTTLSAMFVLERHVHDAVAARATQFSAEASALAGLGTGLTTNVLSGFSQALRGGAVLDWAGLEPLLIVAAAERGSASCEAVRLLRAAVQTDALPVDAAGWAWQILTAALEPDAHADQERDAMLRAEAVHTVADFARWARRTGHESAAADVLAGIDSRTVPEPVGTAVGAETWVLLELGHRAAAERLAALTPGTAGFTGYLRTYRQSAEHQMLGVFGQALSAADLPEADHQKLGSRLLHLYFDGVIDLQPGGLAERWWCHDHTTAETVRDLASYLARFRLHAGKDGDAFNAYLDWRLDTLAPAPGTLLQGPARTELMTLAPTALRTAPIGEALARLGRIVESTGELPAAPELWQRLLEASRTEPATVLDLLHTWSKHVTGTSLAPGRRDTEIEAIWRAGLASGDPAQVASAKDAINRAARSGFHRYLRLLGQTSSDTQR